MSSSEKLHSEPGPEPTPQKNWRNIFTRFQTDKLYPRSHEANASIHNPAIHASRLALFRAAAKNFILLQLLFFVLFLYLFGGLYTQNTQINHLTVAFVDYDGGAIGGAVREAYRKLEGNKFPRLIEFTPDEFAGPSDLRRAVCGIDHWAALYVQPGASDALQQALASNSLSYNKSAIMQYIWNEARYSAVTDSDISNNLKLLANTAKPIYASSSNWTSIIPNPDANTYATFADSWTLASDNIQPTTQGARLVYNTLVVILLMIQEFFYLGTLNALYDAQKIYTKLSPHRIIFFRLLLSLCYCLIGSLCITAAIWIFKSGWDVDGSQFVLTWMALWLFAHLNFLMMDCFTVWLPGPFVPMALVAWLICNVVSILVPFELMSDFFRWSYAMPAHCVYNTLLDIWSRGCNPVLAWALPILFAYEILGLFFSGLGVHRRSHYAIIRAEAEERASSERFEAAVALEKKKRMEEREKFAKLMVARKGRTETGEEIELSLSKEEEMADDVQDRQDIEKILSEETRKKEMFPERPTFSFGPSFGFGLTSGDTGDASSGASLSRTQTFPERLRNLRRNKSAV